ncbi:DUF2922 domain-containing protein [Clostridium ganghwense]|uniref:DUF2922 domain-containing protein n=1 Tax=Clostridium ganghwense TaxID=312089 RepID=A0ABT4CQC0_9CLOT|nr:DUF2922 domain-containing protein [Clostridium ganghwense]MCY6371232.1 DUF2922 domain-containing protein [Clostridium ganghwense]
MRTLVMNFLTSGGKKTTIRIKDVKEGLDATEVSNIMDTIIAKNIFISASGDLKLKDSADIVVTTNQELDI